MCMVHSGPKTRCGKTSPWMRYSPFTEELPKVLPWQAVGLMYFFSQMRPISSASFELSLGSVLSSMSWLQSPSDTLAGKRCDGGCKHLVQDSVGSDFRN